MATEKNITMKQFNGTDYDTLYPKTIASQIPDVYSKNQTINAETLSKYGLGENNTPNDVFNWLGRYAQYWWRRRINTTEAIPAGYTLLSKENVTGTPTTVSYTIAQKRTVSATITYGTEISVSNDGVVSINNAQTITVTVTSGHTSSNLSVTEYWEATGLFFSVSEIGSTIYYGADGCTFAVTSYTMNSDNCIIAINGVQKVAGYPATTGASVGEWVYLYSTNRNAYPDSGITNNYEYEYLNIPFNNAVTAPAIETGSYTGTGTYGSDNPNSLTFDFEPKFLIVGVDNSKTGWQKGCFIWIDGMTNGLSGISGTTYNTVTLEWGNTVSWYSTSALAQLNNSGDIHFYIAIG